jgi:hypothetical protein
MTYVAQMDFTGVTRKNLSSDMRVQLGAWTEGLTQGGKKGLWLFGARRAGTSYIGRVVIGDLAFHRGYTDGMQVKALDLIDEIRGSWSMSAQVRTSMDDMGLWWELKNVEDMLDTYFHRLQVLWIDQLHDETIELPLWKKHIQPRIEDRVEEGQIVIVSTTMPPDDSAFAKGVIEDMFTTIFCDGYRPDAER